MDSWEDVATIGIALGVTYAIVLWLSLAYWVYRDARGRSNDPVSQAVAVLLVLIFNVLGLLIYVVLRPKETLMEAYERSLENEAMLQELEQANVCPSCRRRVQDDYLLCPYCRTSLREPCGQCARPLNLGWVACPYCGSERMHAAAASAVAAAAGGAPSWVPRARPRPSRAPGPSSANTEPLP